MRWTGEEDENEKGYPRQGNYPTWFQLPNDGIWSTEMFKAISIIKKEELDDAK
jgi:hypothetical protein